MKLIIILINFPSLSILPKMLFFALSSLHIFYPSWVGDAKFFLEKKGINEKIHSNFLCYLNILSYFKNIAT
jgi:hypothetical protein